MNPRRHRHAFTLIELLVAAGITAFLASLMVAIVSHTAELWSRSAERLRCEAVARGILSQVETDLSASLRHDGSVLAAIVADTTGLPATVWDPTGSHSKPNGPISLRLVAASLNECRFGAGGVWLRLITTRMGQNSDLDSISAPVAVAYHIARRKRAPTAREVSYLLCRSEVRPASTDGTSPGTLEIGYDLSAAGYAADVADAYGDSASVAGASVLADGVIDFGLRAYVYDPAVATGLRQVFPAGEGAETARIYPDVVDLMIRILTDTGVQRVAQLESGRMQMNTADDAWWELVIANSHVFTQRIVVVASGS